MTIAVDLGRKATIPTKSFLQLLHFILDFFMEANTMDPDQTWEQSWDQSDLGPYCLQ